jgi:hypothetical protein
MVAPLPVADLAAASSSVVINGQQLTLVASLWRDFMPVAPPDGQPLAAILRVQAPGGVRISSTFHVDAAWLVNGGEVWATGVGDERIETQSPMYYEVIARDGPKWAPGASVDVVVRIRESSGTTYLLRAAGQRIQRTD